MTGIPDDVMKAAYVVRRRCDQHIRTDGMSFYLDDECDEIIARAIMAERERCANEARRYAGFYPQSSDGRNTFIMLVDFIESGRKGGAA